MTRKPTDNFFVLREHVRKIIRNTVFFLLLAVACLGSCFLMVRSAIQDEIVSVDAWTCVYFALFLATDRYPMHGRFDDCDCGSEVTDD